MQFDNLKSVLIKKGYLVTSFETAQDAVNYLDKQIDGTSVGFGGSVTLEQMGLYEKLGSHNEVIWHQKIPANKTALELRKEACSASIYLSSVNGLAETGEIVNIDGSCNRVASIFFGHDKVYLIVGKNKITKDYESALWRARNIAAPLNAKRLNRKTPCAEKADKCYDCSSPDRICCGLSVHWRAPMTGKTEIVLINEDLGY